MPKPKIYQQIHFGSLYGVVGASVESLYREWKGPILPVGTSVLVDAGTDVDLLDMDVRCYLVDPPAEGEAILMRLEFDEQSLEVANELRENFVPSLKSTGWRETYPRKKRRR